MLKRNLTLESMKINCLVGSKIERGKNRAKKNQPSVNKALGTSRVEEGIFFWKLKDSREEKKSFCQAINIPRPSIKEGGQKVLCGTLSMCESVTA